MRTARNNMIQFFRFRLISVENKKVIADRYDLIFGVGNAQSGDVDWFRIQWTDLIESRESAGGVCEPVCGNGVLLGSGTVGGILGVLQPVFMPDLLVWNGGRGDRSFRPFTDRVGKNRGAGNDGQEQQQRSHAPWHFLYFFPLPQGQGSLRPTLGPPFATVLLAVPPPLAPA